MADATGVSWLDLLVQRTAEEDPHLGQDHGFRGDAASAARNMWSLLGRQPPAVWIPPRGLTQAALGRRVALFDRVWAALRAGDYRVTAVDLATGRRGTVPLDVLELPDVRIDTEKNDLRVGAYHRVGLRFVARGAASTTLAPRMRSLAEATLKDTGQPGKRADLVARLRAATGASHRAAVAAYQALPAKLRRPIGRAK